MKIGIVSDTHMPWACKHLPNKLREGLEGVDLILHAGDWTSLDVYEHLRTIAPVKGVTGNVDGSDVIHRFDSEFVVELEGFRIGVVHGYRGKGRTTPERAANAFSEEKPDIIIFGHSHIPYDEVINGVRLFNPGSPTDKRRQPRFSFGLMELGNTIQAKHIFYDKK